MTDREIEDLIEDTFDKIGELKGTCLLREDLFEILLQSYIKQDYSNLCYFNKKETKQVQESVFNTIMFQQYKIIKNKQELPIIVLYDDYLKNLWFNYNSK